MNHKKIRILILGPYLNEKGGVREFVVLLLRELNDKCEIKYFPIGRRNKVAYYCVLPVYFIIDIFSYIFTLIIFRPNIIHLNPSLGNRSILRDAVYMMLAKIFKRKTLVFMHGWNSNLFNTSAHINFLLRLCLNIILFQSSRLIVLAHKFKNFLIDAGVKSSKIDVFSIMIEYKKYASSSVARDISNTKILFMANFFKDTIII